MTDAPRPPDGRAIDLCGELIEALATLSELTPALERPLALGLDLMAHLHRAQRAHAPTGDARLEQLEEFLACRICLRVAPIVHGPRYLTGDCRHGLLCEECVRGVFASRALRAARCPVCRQQFRPLIVFL